MSIVAHLYRFVIGVDTHARNHVYAVIAALTGQVVATASSPTSPAGRKRALAWAGKRSGDASDTLWVIEGTGSYGAILSGQVAAAGYQVSEAARADTRSRHGLGKSDEFDAIGIAAGVLGVDHTQLRTPRLDDGARAALQILLTARDAMSGERTRAVNALTALLRTHDLGVDARRPLSAAVIDQISRWRRRDESLAIDVARTEAIRLARRIAELDAELSANKARITELVELTAAAPLLNEPGYGPISAATCMVAYSHPGRVRSEAAFASLAGVNPIPASSGNTVRHRLNRGGDRQLNRAFHTVAMTRMTFDPETRAYVEKRRAQGKTDREIRRCLKRYLARKTHRTLNKTKPAQSST